MTSLHQKIISMGLASSPANRVYTFRKELAVLHPPPHSVGAQQKEVGHSHHCEPAQIICPGCHLHCTESFIILGDENDTEWRRAGIEIVEEQRKAHNQQALLLRTHNSAITIGSPHSTAEAGATPTLVAKSWIALQKVAVDGRHSECTVIRQLHSVWPCIALCYSTFKAI